MPVIIKNDKREAGASTFYRYKYVSEKNGLCPDLFKIAHTTNDEKHRMDRLIKLCEYIHDNIPCFLKYIEYLQDHKGNLFVIFHGTLKRDMCLKLANDLQVIWEEEFNESFVEVYIP
jgi:hypothetical protein